MRCSFTMLPDNSAPTLQCCWSHFNITTIMISTFIKCLRHISFLESISIKNIKILSLCFLISYTVVEWNTRIQLCNTSLLQVMEHTVCKRPVCQQCRSNITHHHKSSPSMNLFSRFLKLSIVLSLLTWLPCLFPSSTTILVRYFFFVYH